MNLSKEDVKAIAKEIHNLQKAQQKKIKAYLKGKIIKYVFKDSSTDNSTTDIKIQGQKRVRLNKHSYVSCTVVPDNLGEVMIYLRTLPVNYVFNIDEWKNLIKALTDVLKEAEELDNNLDMKDVLDP